MKKYFLAFFCLISIVVSAQTDQHALYIYRNDKSAVDFFFKSDIDSITFSCYDLDSLPQADIVTQIIHTKDSIHYIPIAAIDSIVFIPPKPDSIIDWTHRNPIYIPLQPSCAIVNITGTSELPIKKNTNMPAWMEVWDGQGHYFKKRVILDMQGNSSGALEKKNFSADFFEDEEAENDTQIRIEKWVSQNSFHFKAYHTSITKGECPVCYKLFDKFLATKPRNKRAPYMEYAPESWTSYNDGDGEENNGFARCYPDGFPCIVYVDDEYYGIFSWQLKKHRDNFNMDRNKTDNIHLDGVLGSSNIWNGSVTWSTFEVRNPKPKDKKWTLTDINGKKYDGNSPKELIGTDSPLYDSSNINHVNTAKTKSSIVALSKYMEEIAVYESFLENVPEFVREEALSIVKQVIEKRFSMEWLIDYVILINIVEDYDSTDKNWQWTTWGDIDGKTKWFVCPYDMDSAFGVYPTTGFMVSNPSKSVIGKNTNTPARYVYSYYMDEMKKRYAELRDSGVISYETIYGLVEDWYNRVGEDNYAKEAERWPEMTCNRDSYISDDWSYTGKSYITFWGYANDWLPTTTYTDGKFCKYKYRCYMSLQDNNQGNVPTKNDTIWWKDMSVKPGIYHAGDLVYDGRCNFYQFKALKDIEVIEDINNFDRTDHLVGAPFEKLYVSYPHEGGVHDNIERISKWIKRKIELSDEQMDYHPDI